MPIKPENRSRYPADWKQIRARILKRANDCCEQCRVANGDMIVRGIDKDAGTFQRFEGDGEVYAADDGRLLGRCKASEYCGNKWTRVVLTIAHLGLPAHLPVNLHVTRSAEADEVFKIVGLLMPLDAEIPEWHAMMHRRALTEFYRGATAVSARFFVALPSGNTRLSPGLTVMHETFPVTPEAIVLTGWRLLGKPVQTAIVSAETAPGVQIEAADLELLSTSFAGRFTETALAAANGFIATGRRARLDSIGRLLSSDGKASAANYAIAKSRTSTLGAPDAGTFNTRSDGRIEFSRAIGGAGLSATSSLMGELGLADPAIQSEGAFTWTGHAKLCHDAEYPEHCDESNLKALCQRCHLAYDAEHHRANAQATRHARKAIGDLFALAEGDKQ